MFIMLFLAIITIMSLVLHYPILRKNISADDGNWFYISVFRRYGIYNLILRKKKLFNTLGFFNLHTIYQFIFFIFNKEDADFSKKIKYYWYVLTDVAVFVTSYILWGNPLLSFIISLIYIVQICQPETFSDLTYAEFFVVLPFCITISLFHIGLDLSSVYLIFFAGCMASIVYQIKPIYVVILAAPLFINQKFVFSIFHFQYAKFKIIYNGYSKDYANIDKCKNKDEKMIVLVGKVSSSNNPKNPEKPFPLKGYDLFIEAAKEMSNYYFTLIGICGDYLQIAKKYMI